MISAFRAEDVRAAEAPLLAQETGFGNGLMHRAATALAVAVQRELRVAVGQVVGTAAVGLVGRGNNGGDTLHALALLARRGVRCTAVLTSATVHDGGLAALQAAGGVVLAVVDGAPGERVWIGDALAEAFSADVVLDGLLGIGGRGGLRDEAAELVVLLAELLDTDTGRQQGSGRPGPRQPPVTVAVDVPSGIGVDDGVVHGPVLPADLTVTFGALKPGLLLPPASRLAGRVELVDLGLTPVLASQTRQPAVDRLTGDDLQALWPVPGRTAHKYSRGVAGIVAGSSAYPGAAVLAVAGALGAGCGMVRYVGPYDVTNGVRAAHPEVVAGDGRVQAWVVGPGVDPADREQVAQVRRALADAQEHGLPVVLDAGALGLLRGPVGPLAVLTPHAGELATFLAAGGLDVDRAGVEAEPLRWARVAQAATGATVLLKGATTLVVGPEGAFAQDDAPPWLATAGAGDVLAGVLGALLAGHADELRDEPSLVPRLAALAAAVHGRAAHAANPGGPVTASAVASALPAVVADLLSAAPWSAPGRRARFGHASRAGRGHASRRRGR